MTDGAPDLAFIARQLERVLTDIGSLRDEVHVQAAHLRRLDVAVAALFDEMQANRREMRAIRDQIERMNDRVRRLEDTEQP